MKYNRYITFRAGDEHKQMLGQYNVSELLRYMIENKEALLDKHTLNSFRSENEQ